MKCVLLAPTAMFLKRDLALDELSVLPAPIIGASADLANQANELILGHEWLEHSGSDPKMQTTITLMQYS